jgi:predicted SnoaL-like aldol condensation-catalyzing enzyme
LIRNTPDTLRYEHHIVAEDDYVIVHGRFSGHGRPAGWIAADIVRIENGRLAEHWDVLQDEDQSRIEKRPPYVWRSLKYLIRQCT